MRLNTIPWYLSSPSLSLFFFLFLLSLCLSVCLSVCLSQSAPPQATEPYNKMKQVMLNTLLWYPSFRSLSLFPFLFLMSLCRSVRQSVPRNAERRCNVLVCRNGLSRRCTCVSWGMKACALDGQPISRLGDVLIQKASWTWHER